VVAASTLCSRQAAAQDVYDKVAEAGRTLVWGDELAKLDAAALLGELRAVYSVGALEQALSDPSTMVRMAAVDALGRIAHAAAVDALVAAAHDDNPLVALAAVSALGDMHIHPAYDALMGLLPAAGDEDLREAVLAALREWNDPHTPLPPPVELAPGREPPDFTVPPGSGPAAVKGEGIDPCNPYDPTAEIPPGGCEPVAAPEVHDAPAGIDSENPYGPAQISGQPLAPGGDIDPHNPYEALTGPPPAAVQAALPAPPAPGPPAQTVETVFVAPFVPGQWDLFGGSRADISLATASVPEGTARVVALHVSGEWVGRWVGAGGVVPLSGGSGFGPGGAGEYHFGNIGLWVRHRGRRELGSVSLLWGAALTLHLPTGSRVAAPDPDGAGADFLAAAAALYSRYTDHAMYYPDLEDTFEAGIVPVADVGLLFGRVYLQAELGFDFIVLGSSRDPDTGTGRDIEDLSLMKLALAVAVRCRSWLQVSLAVQGVLELHGRSLSTYAYDREIVGRPAGHEAFVTPGLTVLVPLGDIGDLPLSAAVRIPLGEVASSSGPLALDPIVLLSTGLRFSGR
jgi:hypothetical protein